MVNAIYEWIFKDIDSCFSCSDEVADHEMLQLPFGLEGYII